MGIDPLAYTADQFVGNGECNVGIDIQYGIAFQRFHADSCQYRGFGDFADIFIVADLGHRANAGLDRQAGPGGKARCKNFV